MAKQSISNGLLQMKFMQRAHMKDEVGKLPENNEMQGEWIMPMKNSSGSQNRCAVIMEGDPKPGALSGRMSFQNFNPSIDKLFEEAEGTHKRKLVAFSEAAGKSNVPNVQAETVDRPKNKSVSREELCEATKSEELFQDQSKKKLKVGTSGDGSLSAYRGNCKHEDKKAQATEIGFKKPSDQYLGQGRVNWRHLGQSTH